MPEKTDMSPSGGRGPAGTELRICTDRDIPAVFAIINDAAEAYRGIIPADRWKDPYMDLDELCS